MSERYKQMPDRLKFALCFVALNVGARAIMAGELRTGLSIITAPQTIIFGTEGVDQQLTEEEGKMVQDLIEDVMRNPEYAIRALEAAMEDPELSSEERAKLSSKLETLYKLEELREQAQKV